eukprot:m.21157 g.21157  ORF g.21157 m.21157 type:complete len:52 (+) comp5660_c0_seq1:1106-1261(+)
MFCPLTMFFLEEECRRFLLQSASCFETNLTKPRIQTAVLQTRPLRLRHTDN